MKYKLFDPPKLTGEYLQDVLESKWLTTGYMNDQLKMAVASFVECKFQQVVLASSATAGFQGVLDYISMWERCGKYPMGVHITDATWPGMLQAIAHARNVRMARDIADIIVMTDVGGSRFIDDSPADRRSVYIHDACHSWLPDPEADFAIMSFYPTKLVPGAEGGAVICKREEDVEPLERWLYCGIRPGQPGEPSVPGRKANMTDVAAALNLEALELAPRYIEDIAKTWMQMREAAEMWKIPYREQRGRQYLFQIVVDKVHAHGVVPETRQPAPAEMIARLKKRGVPATWNFPPAPLVTLPCYPGLTLADAMDIMKIVKEEL